MPIQLLLPQLANQIAAGEIVYRPSSVVKELIENSLDAGATRIDIDIEQGGTKSIRIRDNGSGIAKDELALALARHATSKIASIEDLERITSLGFRGEALASVSSVSRLNLTSRIAEQNEAWQAYKEGRNLAITIKPAAHPVGTTIEVLDLFYNTPARRKFMSTAKNEFTHIDDVTRRIALSRFDVTFSLQHNGKIVRQYRAASHKNQHQRRLVRLCGPDFVKRAMGVSYHNGDLTLHGWIANTDGIAIPTLKYSYVNRRIMNDRLINHIIRNAYKDKFNKNQQPAFVLFLEIDPYQIDVNFHPNKHKVRFYQNRLVHDFIYQAVANTLQQYSVPVIDSNESCEQNKGYCSASKILPVLSDDVLLQYKYTTWPVAIKRTTKNIVKDKPLANIDFCQSLMQGRDKYDINDQQKAGYLQRQLVQTSPIQEKTANSVQQQTENGSSSHSNNEDKNASTTLSTINVIAEAAFMAEPNTASQPPSFGTVLTIFEYCYALIKSTHQLALISLPVAERYLNEHKLIPGNALLSAQQLIIPLRITLCAEEIATLKKYQFLLQEMGLYLQPNLHQAILHTVPLLLSKQNLPNLIPEMLNYLTNEIVVTNNHIAVWIARRIQQKSSIWSQLQAIQLLTQVECLCPQWVQNPPHGFMVHLNFKKAIKALNYE